MAEAESVGCGGAEMEGKQPCGMPQLRLLGRDEE